MKLKLLFLILGIFLIVPSLANAVLNDAYGYFSGDNAQNVGGNRIQDMANTTHNFTNSSALAGKTGIIKQGYQFTNNPERKILMNKKLNQSNNWTMVAWFNSSNGTADQSVIKPASTTGDNSMLFSSGVGNDDKARCLIDAAVDIGSVVSTSIITNVTTMVVCRFNGTHINLYINNTLEAVDTVATPDDDTTDIIIGGHPTVAESLIGTLDEAGIWYRDLDKGCNDVGEVCTGEIADLFNNGLGFNPYVSNDTSPVAITFINLSSGNGVIFNNSAEELGKLSGRARSNDSTPTYKSTTNESANCALMMTNDDGWVESPSSPNNGSVIFHFKQNATDEGSLSIPTVRVGASLRKLEPRGYFFNGSDGDNDAINLSSSLKKLAVNQNSSFTVGIKYKKFAGYNNYTPLFSQMRGSAFSFLVAGDTDDVGNIVVRLDDGTVISTVTPIDNNTVYYSVVTIAGQNLLDNIKIYHAPCSAFGYCNISLNTSGSGYDTSWGTHRWGIGTDSRHNFNFTGEVYEAFLILRNLSEEEVRNITLYGITANMNYSKMIELNSSRVCSTTGTTAHTCTTIESDSVDIGLASGFISCQDTSNNLNENKTSTSGLFYVNITDGNDPDSTLFRPRINEFFQIGVNTSNINFTFFGTDNRDKNLTAVLLIDEVVQITNTSYLNGTNVTYLITYTTLGRHNWSVRMTDSFNNINYSGNMSFSIQQLGTVSISLNGRNDTKYEYRTTANISANCTEAFGGDCGVCLTLTEPRYLNNYTCGTNQVSMLVNLSTLRIYNFSHGPSSVVLSASSVLNVTNNNKSIIDRVSLNVTSSGETTNLNISYHGKSKKLLGTLKTIYLENNRFIHNNIEKDAVNITLLTGTSELIYSNLTDIENPINLSFLISGFDLDKHNEFTYTEHFNKTPESKGINDTLTFQSDSPIGIFDDFKINVSGRWSHTSGCGVFGYFVTDPTPTPTLQFACAKGESSGEARVDYSDASADLRNSSRIENEITWTYEGPDPQPGNGYFEILATDGTSSVSLYLRTLTDATGTEHRNFTFIKASSDYKTWQIFDNNSLSSTKDISILNFANQIKLRWKTSGQNRIKLYNVKWSGAWLNYSSGNGTYKPTGNVTSKVVNVTQTNVTKSTLTAVEYKPSGTGINYFLSNTCNATLPTFEPVTSGITHTFVTTGNSVCWRANMSSSTNTTSPVVRLVTISVTKSEIQNISVDLGDDGIIEQRFTGTLNSTAGPFSVNLTPIAGRLNTIKISSGTAGIIQINNFTLNSSVNPINLNKTNFENCQDNSTCSINFTFGGDALTVNALEFEILGSLNYTATANYSTFRDIKIVQIFYSFFNASIASKYGFYDVFASSQNQTNSTPYTQSDSTPIWNITNLAYDENIDIYARTNFTPSCLNVTYSNYSNRSYVNSLNFTLNGTYKLILQNISVSGKLNFTQINETFNITLNITTGTNSSNINYSIIRNQSIVRNVTNGIQLVEGIDFRIDYESKNFTLINSSFNRTGIYLSYNYTHNVENSKGIWNWWDLYTCGNRFEIPYVFFSSICKNCYFDRTQLDDFNVITN